MSIHLKGILAAAMAGLLANSAMAAEGTISFTGSIVAASCSITGGAGTTVGGSKGDQTIDIDMGKVSIDSLSGAAGGGIAAGKNINLNLDCGETGSGLTTVMVRFDPSGGGTGIDPKNVSLLKTSGTATGVGIGIYDSTNKLLNLAANDTFDAPLVATTTGVAPNEKTTYSANLNIRAAYVKNGDTLGAGTANGTLPFTLTYN